MKVKRVVVESLDEFFEELKELAIMSEGKEEFVSVGSIEELNHILTPQRKRLLDVIKDRKPSSVNELAKLVNRDYKNVYEDIVLLERTGFLKLKREGKKLVPIVDYDVIDVQVKVGDSLKV